MRPVRLVALSLLLSGTGLAPAVGQTGWVDPPTRAPASQPSLQTQVPAEPESAPQPSAQAPRASSRTRAPRAAVDHGEDQAERRTRRSVHPRHPARRLAETPPPARAARPPEAVPPAPRQPAAPEPRLTDWAGAAQALAADYFDAISAPGARMVSDAPRFYAGHVRFHGREMTLTALMAEKRSFAQRWPDRSYEPRAMRTACNGALGTCIVRAQVAFRAASPNRGALSQGLAEVVLEVSLAGPRPIIVAESSRVLRREHAASTGVIPDRKA